MTLATILAIAAVLSPMLSTGGLIAWFKLGPERRKLQAGADKEITDTHSLIIDDLNKAYLRINEELNQTQMRVKVSEQEHENCRKQIRELQSAVALLQVEIGRQSRLSALARARSHVAVKTLGSYELHIDFLLDEMRKAKVEITPIMRTSKLRTAFQAQLERLEAMEVQELEVLLKQQLGDAFISSSSRTENTNNISPNPVG